MASFTICNWGPWQAMRKHDHTQGYREAVLFLHQNGGCENEQTVHYHTRNWIRVCCIHSLVFFLSFFNRCAPITCEGFCSFQMDSLYKCDGCISLWWGVMMRDVVVLDGHWSQGVAHYFTVQFRPASSPLVSQLFVLATRKIIGLVWHVGIFSQPIISKCLALPDDVSTQFGMGYTLNYDTPQLIFIFLCDLLFACAPSPSLCLHSYILFL